MCVWDGFKIYHSTHVNHKGKNMSASATIGLNDMLFIVSGQQWSSIAQWDKLYRALDTQILID